MKFAKFVTVIRFLSDEVVAASGMIKEISNQEIIRLMDVIEFGLSADNIPGVMSYF